ncbi:hypothetical protein LIER_04153 [Lithospermum erythrorhizon]|uniref:Reverse transcriptase domain-containing protein n=1 Tax=Lithospermum erythrorhizon TaxID=34254 RepID=A0AAV3NZW3_LITER
MSDFRPISLSNIVAKIIGRVMTNRLRLILMHIIFEIQSAVLPGHIISDNILIAHELLHHISYKANSKNSLIALKLDMSKAYDQVEWSFLKAIMLKLGFCRTWVDWTMCFISFVSCSFLINGAPRGFVRPTRGIHQGDPFSSHLFLLCAEGLTCMLRDAEIKKGLTGIKISRESPKINHILFTDDTMIFCKANKEEGNEVMRFG